MSAMSDYSENKFLDHFLATSAFTMPTTIYLGLYTAAPSDAGGTELSGSAYVRRSIAFSAASSGSAANSAIVEFPQASGSWGTVTHFGIFDALTTGNLLFHGAFTASKTIEIGDIFRVNAGDITVTAA